MMKLTDTERSAVTEHLRSRGFNQSNAINIVADMEAIVQKWEQPEENKIAGSVRGFVRGMNSAVYYSAVPEMPTFLRLGAKIYTIHHDDESWAQLAREEELGGACGWTDNRTLRIYVEPGQAMGEQQDTLLHEVLHAMWAQGPNIQELPKSDREEYLVARQSPWLLMVLRDNPQLIEFLTYKDEDHG